ncbi:DNA-(apurinic or apyrimidinic site) lyase /Formamidopyrimidine-DNA glycosylase [Streptomyces sp. TLI_053]|uniref:Fpg/Nei family DNA glycosylase n=1 Tax=Streptomyces sp. TLI_053 TaxID=1855352 RepID=UPI00087ABC33|nr:DNA-formamidopyrimidine glycosylase family protein [Streptomyces sp. TLI_053]SDT81448.1 DNA-(apurinic or apyrimidinic site) lyase /Formamidopyrimidine-DNA glycosylase [Streptomyces sp. TLI_053]
MPELPEVEALTVFLSARLTGRVIAEVRPVAISALKTYDPPVTALAGRTVGPVVRHGKFLDIGVDGLHLVVHLARAGWLRWREHLPVEPPKPGGRNPLALRVRLEGPDGDGFDLTEAGTKKGLAVYVVRDAGEVPGVARLGPDPFDPDFDLERFRALLAGERRRIKGVLRDQSVLAGVGNAYSDEVLHVARMSPYKLAADLSAEETARLFEALGSTLREAVERSRGLAAGELKAEKKLGMRVHGRTGQPCPVCGDTVREVSFADSSLQYCPTCQTGGKPLADRRMSRLLK